MITGKRFAMIVRVSQSLVTYVQERSSVEQSNLCTLRWGRSWRTVQTQKVKACDYSPRCTDGDRVFALGRESVSPFSLCDGRLHERHRLAPSSKSNPMPSNRLSHDVEKAEASWHLRLWSVLPNCSSQEAVAALANCTGKQILAVALASSF